MKKHTRSHFMQRFALVAIIALSFCFFWSNNISAQVQESDFPDNKTYDTVAAAGKKIGENLCKKTKKDKAACIEKYKQEYLFLANKKCGNDKKCYTDFVKNNKKMGQARKAAGFPASKPVDYDGVAAGSFAPAGSEGEFQCGKGDTVVNTKFNLGCVGDEADQDNLSPVLDMAFAVIRFLSVGVGVVVIASIVYAGIQYSSSQGNPEATAAAKDRIQNAIIALIFYMFIFAIVQFLVPGGLFGLILPPTPLTGGIT